MCNSAQMKRWSEDLDRILHESEAYSEHALSDELREALALVQLASDTLSVARGTGPWYEPPRCPGFCVDCLPVDESELDAA